MIRRDQIVALIEAGVFDDEHYSAKGDCVFFLPHQGLPRPGVISTDLMHLAYHIKDDRFEYVDGCANSDKTRKLRKNLAEEGSQMAWDRELNGATKKTSRVDETSPLLHQSGTKSREISNGRTGSSGATSTETPTQLGERPTFKASNKVKYASVSQSDDYNYYISWLNPEFRAMHVNVLLAMNQGVFCVPEFCPVSKARSLFTKLGLRHIVVCLM